MQPGAISEQPISLQSAVVGVIMSRKLETITFAVPDCTYGKGLGAENVFSTDKSEMK